MTNIRTTKPDVSSYQNSSIGRGPVGVSSATTVKKARGAVGASNSSEGAPEKWKRDFYFARKNGEPVIYEYELTETWWGKYTGYKLRKPGQLNYQTNQKRGWYKAGDLMFCFEHTMKYLEKKYPELGGSSEDEGSVLSQLAIGFILGEPKKYKLSYKIIKIHIESDHKGKIECCPVLFLDDKTTIELNPIPLDYKNIEHKEVFSTLIRKTSFTKSMIGYFGEAVLAFSGGVVGGATRAGLRGVVKYSLKEAIKISGKKVLIRRVWLRMRSNLGQASVKATKDYLLTFAKEMRNSHEIQSLSTKAKNGSLPKEDLQKANILAWKAFTSTLVTESLSLGLAKTIGKSGLSEVQKEITSRLTIPFTVGVPKMLIEAMGEAAAKNVNQPGQFDKNFSEAFYAVFKNELMSIVSIDLKKIGEEFAFI